MNVDRLHTLAKFLRQVPAKDPKKFALDAWVEIDEEEGLDTELLQGGTIVDKDLIKATCGMTACAVGWAGSIKEFQDAGLRIQISNDGIAQPMFGRYDSWGAVEKFFDIPNSLAHRLFMPDHYEEDEDGRCTATANDVADRIDEMTGKSSKANVLSLLV